MSILFWKVYLFFIGRVCDCVVQSDVVNFLVGHIYGVDFIFVRVELMS